MGERINFLANLTFRFGILEIVCVVEVSNLAQVNKKSDTAPIKLA